MSLWSILKSFLFRLDAERAHRCVVRLLRIAGPGPISLITGAKSLPSPGADVLGLRFRSRVGLAAGFDKDAELVELLPAMGFGFAEIGTVTPRPQPGNEKPRLFRDVERTSLFNRMGFNGHGAETAARRLAQARAGLPEGFRVGVNVGKNKDTPLEDAPKDYRQAAKPFKDLADYIVLNVSSPNTPGLRSLQTREALLPLIDAVRSEIAGWKSPPPLLLKLAPEVRGPGLAEILEAGPSWGVDGWVLTNTWGGELTTHDGKRLVGGWSGSMLTQPSREALVEARSLTRLPIISVGGIMSAEEARERLRLGADLVQIYSGWIFGGPGFPAQIARATANLSP